MPRDLQPTFLERRMPSRCERLGIQSAGLLATLYSLGNDDEEREKTT
jgi:hypothetical protein